MPDNLIARWCAILTSFLVLLSCLFSQLSWGAAKIQERYLADEPLPKIAKRLSSEGMTDQEIIDSLKTQLTKITPELAQERFGITWLEEVPYDQVVPTSEAHYPAVAICNMQLGPNIGYGLFALDHIKSGAVIAEYTGQVRKETGPYAIRLPDQTYLDAASAGNAARFALHLISDKELGAYRYEPKLSSCSGLQCLIFWGTKKEKAEIATANADLVPILLDNNRLHIFLRASRDIRPFEQIGFYYDISYGFEDSVWPEEPILFNKEADPIPRSEYKRLDKIVRLTDERNKFVFYVSAKDMVNLIKLIKVTEISYAMLHSMDENNKQYCFITNRETYERQLAKPRDRITLPGYSLRIKHEDTSMLECLKFMVVIEEIEIAERDHDNQVQANKLAILSAAREGKYSKIYKLMGEKKSQRVKQKIQAIKDSFSRPEL